MREDEIEWQETIASKNRVIELFYASVSFNGDILIDKWIIIDLFAKLLNKTFLFYKRY